MLTTIFMVLGVTTVGSATSLGLLYLFNKPVAIEISTHISWNMVRLYHKINLKYEKCRNKYNKKQIKVDYDSNYDSDFESDLEDKESNEFIGLENVDNHINKYCSNELSNNYIKDTNFDLMFLKNTNNLYKRIENKEEIKKDATFDELSRPFIQIELISGNHKESIHKHLTPFYVKENKILDKLFLKWYVKTFYDIELEDDYKLNLIDSNVNMLTITNDKYIKLGNKDIPYDIVNV
jgi:hypothetical protein